MIISNSPLSFFSFCQRETLHLCDPFPAKDIIFDVARRILIVASLIIPLIGLIACCIKQNIFPEPSLRLPTHRSTQFPGLSQSSGQTRVNPSSTNLAPAPNRNQSSGQTQINPSSTNLPPTPNRNQSSRQARMRPSQRNPFQEPNVHQDQLLKWVDLSNRNLLEAPDLSNRPLLEELSLCGNRLTEGPDLSRIPKLKSLGLSSNRLTEAPDLSHSPNLEGLWVDDNNLLQPPDIRYNPRLNSLYLSRNQLPQPPDVSRNPLLHALSLCDNRLTEPPDVRNNPLLSFFSLSNNQLTQPPDVSRNPNLFHFHLPHNRLTHVPDLSHNPRLSWVVLSSNLLTTLPDCILRLRSDCSIYAEHNRFSEAYVMEFQARLAAQRQLDPSTGPRVYTSVYDHAAAALPINSLEGELASWAQRINSPIDFSPLTSMNCENRSLLLTYLTKLKHTADYQNPNAMANIIVRVQNMLRLACEKAAFREVLLSLMLEGSTSCGDRVILLFNDIEVQSQVYLREYTEQDLANLIVKIQRYELLKAHAKKQADERRLGDEVETVLYYQIKLKNVLFLPITTVGMLYPAMSGVSEGMLATAREEISSLSKLDLLAGSELWREHLKKGCPDAFTAIEEDSVDQANNLPEDLPSQEYRNRLERIQADREKSLKQRARELTLQRNLQIA